MTATTPGNLVGRVVLRMGVGILHQIYKLRGMLINGGRWNFFFGWAEVVNSWRGVGFINFFMTEVPIIQSNQSIDLQSKLFFEKKLHSIYFLMIG